MVKDTWNQGQKKNQGAPRLPPPPRCSRFSPALLPWPWVWWFLMDPGNCVCPRKLCWYEFPTRPLVPAVCMCWWRVCKLNWRVTARICLQLCVCWACVVTGVQKCPAWSAHRGRGVLGLGVAPLCMLGWSCVLVLEMCMFLMSLCRGTCVCVCVCVCS